MTSIADHAGGPERAPHSAYAGPQPAAFSHIHAPYVCGPKHAHLYPRRPGQPHPFSAIDVIRLTSQIIEVGAHRIAVQL